MESRPCGTKYFHTQKDNMFLIEILSYMNNISRISSIILTIPVALLALTVHEVAQGYAAYKMGDPTARNSGRLSLNPLKHLDPLGALCMLFFHFGWAKPVPINSRNFRNPRCGTAITAIAGPVSNFIIAFVSIIFWHVLVAILNLFPANYEMTAFTCKFLAYVLVFFQISVSLNVSLGIFNMLPIPPLNGSRVLFVFLPVKYYFGIMKYERYISLGLLLLLYSGFLDAPLAFLVSNIIQGMEFIVNLIPFI